jgi:cysteine-rich repeat protein
MLCCRFRISVSLLLALLVVSVSPAHALVNLTAGKRLMATDGFNPKQDRITFRFLKDPGLFSLQSPLCPTQTKLRFVSNHQVTAELTLDCSKWKVAGSGFRYSDKPAGPGSALRITYRVGTLVVTAQGVPYANGPVTGPVDFLETRVTVGGQQYCGRWDAPPGRYLKNTAGKITIAGPTAACQVTCGNGVLESPEICDDGNTTSGDGCDANCKPTGCGNGIRTGTEQCDDGNTTGGDGCSALCKLEVCGDGIRTGSEQCDDGNTQNGDCCSSTCQLASAGSTCTSDGNACTSDVCNATGICQHQPATGPSCDDGNGCTSADVCVAGICQGAPLEPWINEIDYDSPNNDTGEFVELAGPAGKDLSGYHVVSVEGGGALCLTGSAAVGQAYSIGTIPPGTVLADDTGTGIGFLVVCFAGTSTGVASCDVTLPGDASTSNLKDGDLLNLNATGCPDGVLLTNGGGAYVDSASWEGIVPATAPFGPLFHTFTAYAIERDEGSLAGVSIAKTSSTLARATSASEWVDPSELGSPLTCQAQVGLTCPTNTATPGAPNPTQVLECPITQPPYGSASRAFVRQPRSLLD